MNAPSRDWNVARILAHLETLDSPQNREGMARYGIATDRTYGVPMTILRPLGRSIGRDHERALALWETGSREARLLAAFTADPKRLTPEEAWHWAADFDSWDIVDGVADVFAGTAHWRELIDRFAADEREFVRRTAFAMIAWAAVHRKKEPDETFIGLLPLIEKHARDSRNFVKKAVNWAIRQIGKRSLPLHAPALELAERLAASGDKTERWIGKDAVRELTAEKTIAQLKEKAAKAQK
jgi:3-methyladenine DNA glycosylase AlkD